MHIYISTARPYIYLKSFIPLTNLFIFSVLSLFSLSSRTFARTARSTRMNRSGRFRKLGSSSWLRTTTSLAASWKYVVARRYMTFIGEARRSAPKKISRGWYIMSLPRLSSASTTFSHRQISRPARRSLTDRLEWKVKLLHYSTSDQRDAISLFQEGWSS